MTIKQVLDIPLRVKSVSENGEFEGYGSVFGVKDSASDIVVKGAFSKSLDDWREKGQMPAMLWQHKRDEPIGIYTSMTEDDEGLKVSGKLLIDDDPLAKRAYAHLKAGSLSGLSIGYRLNDYDYDKEKDAWMLKEIELLEVSLVTFPANDQARVSSIKSALEAGELPPERMIEHCLRDAGLSRKQAKTLISKGYRALNLRDADGSESLNEIKTFIEKLEL